MADPRLCASFGVRIAGAGVGACALALLLLLAAAAVAAPPAPGAGVSTLPPEEPPPEKLTEPKTPNEIRDAHIQRVIAAGVKYLQSVEQKNGLIGTERQVFNGCYPVGQTALALLAMIEAGVPLKDPHVQAAFSYVFENRTDLTYEVALQAMVLARLPRDRLGRTERRAMERLMKRFVDGQAADGMWTYWLLDPRDVPPTDRGPWGRIVGPTWRGRFVSGDRSNTQFAVLALWEMSKCGVEIPQPTLRRAAEQFLKTQNVESGWGYVNDAEKYGHPKQSPTMNATGLASLYILRDLLGETGEGLFTGTSSLGCGRPGPMDESIEMAYQRVVRDLGNNHGLLFLYGGTPFPRSAYYHYSVERVGVACGLREIGDHDWYREGAWYFLKNQQADGSWITGYTSGVETSLAILFLAKGRAPFLMNKLHWRGDWNNHTRDMANLTRYAENTFEQRFRWQIVDIRGNVDEWLDAPVLYITGHKPIGTLTDDEMKSLRSYAERGGVLLTEACCGSKEFDDSLRALAAKLFPEAPLRELEAEHPIYSSHFRLKPEPRKPLWGVDLPADKLADEGRKLAGAAATRTVLVHIPWAVGCIWNQDLKTNHERAFQLGINVFRYATAQKPLRRPLDGTSKPIAVPASGPTDEPKRRTSDGEDPLK